MDLVLSRGIQDFFRRLHRFTWLHFRGQNRRKPFVCNTYAENGPGNSRNFGLVDTVEAHYAGWRAVADEVGVAFTRSDNDRLRGVRSDLSVARLVPADRSLTSDQRARLLALKAEVYWAHVVRDPSAVKIDGVDALLGELRQGGAVIAVASASRHARQLLDLAGLARFVDCVSGAEYQGDPKPDPGQLLQLARRLSTRPGDCLVVEDAEVGVEAAMRAGMSVLAIGNALLKMPDYLPWLPSLRGIDADAFWDVVRDGSKAPLPRSSLESGEG